MPDKIKTYVLTNLDAGNTGLNSSDISGYEGMLYQIFSAGETGGQDYSPGGGQYNIHGSSSGFVNAGYLDFGNPYIVNNIVIQKNPSNNLIINVTFSDDPTGGTKTMNIQADMGITYENTNAVYDNTNPYATPNGNIRTGFFPGAISANVGTTQDQRNILTGASPTYPKDTEGQGSVISDVYGIRQSDLIYGYGGGGYYGAYSLNNGDKGEGFGYNSGNWNASTNSKNHGYVVISLIPSNIITPNGAISIYPGGDTGIQTASNQNFILYNLLGGGGGGASSNNDAIGAGGGGSGDWITGLLYTNVSDIINVGAGYGGFGAPANELQGGQNGLETVIFYNNNLSNITALGGFGGALPSSDDDYDGAGGAGYYGGGGGGSNKSGPTGGWGGDSYVLIPSYLGNIGHRDGTPDDIGGNGAGSVNYSLASPPVYGLATKATASGSDHTSGGGGGGPWGGNGAVDGKLGGPSNNLNINAEGYGCGGGGGSCDNTPNIGGGNGSGGYALLKYFYNTLNSVKFYKVTQNRIFDIVDYTSAVGFWYFLGGDSGKSYHNTGHFLLKEDGVRSISFIKNNGYFSINVYFAFINNTQQIKQQIFTLQATTPENYAMIMFYY
jgi:hypothetical protein